MREGAREVEAVEMNVLLALWEKFYGAPPGDAERILDEERRAREHREMLRRTALEREAALTRRLKDEGAELDAQALSRYVEEIERIRTSSTRREGDALQDFREAMRGSSDDGGEREGS